MKKITETKTQTQLENTYMCFLFKAVSKKKNGTPLEYMQTSKYLFTPLSNVFENILKSSTNDI